MMPPIAKALTGLLRGTVTILLPSASPRLDLGFDLAKIAAVDKLGSGGQILLDGALDVLERFLLGRPLRPAPR